MRSRKQLTYTFLLIVGVLLLINILSNSYFLRLDFTADKAYTLSKSSKNILKELKSPVTVTAYFSKDLPQNLIQTRRDFNDLLVEYNNVSKGRVKFEFINPSDNEDNERKAQQAGVNPVMVNVREKDQIKNQKAYLGAVVKVGERSEIIPLIQPGAAMEYSLSSAIKKLSITDKPSIGLIQGYGSATLNSISQAYQQLDVIYNVEPVFMNDTSYVLKKYKTIAIIGSRDTIPARYLQQLERYVSEGGNLFIAATHVDGDFQKAMGIVVNTGLEKWLKTHHIVLGDDMVMDANCGTIGAQQQQTGYVMQIKFPYLPILTNFAKHPVTEGLESMMLQFASTITFTGDTSKTAFIPLAFTSERSAIQKLPIIFNIDKQWTEKDFPYKNIPVAAALVPKNSKEGKIIIISNGNFATNGEGQQTHQLNPDNINLLVNSIDWLSDDTGLIDLRTKGVTSRFLKQLDDSTKTILKYLNFLLPILLIVGYGIFRVNRNRNIRIKRMEARYV
jgi:gliding-associated putative ABC transporter substrate-binding component GldG